MARHALLEITAQTLLCLTHGRFEVVDNPLPRDVRVVTCCVQYQPNYFGARNPIRSGAHQTFVLVLDHESFADIPEGAILPHLPPVTIRRLEEDATMHIVRAAPYSPGGWCDV